MQHLNRRQKLLIRINGKIKLSEILFADYCKKHKEYYKSKLHGSHNPVLYCPSCVRENSLKRKQEKEALAQ